MPTNNNALWWHGVDISSTHSKNTEAIPGGLRRTPQWGCVSQFFLSESERAGIEQKSLRRLVDQAQRLPTAAASGGAGRVRPLPAGGTSPTKRAQNRVAPSPFTANAASMDGRTQRPSSAPTLLRNDVPGLHVRKVHENPSIQHLENFAVKREIRTMRREGMFLKDAVADVDVLADPSLFDLKVMHNGVQRARSNSVSSASRRKQHVEESPDSKKAVQPKKAADYVRDLCSSLKSDTRDHCSRMRIPIRAVEDAQLEQLVSQLHRVQNAQLKKDLRSKKTSPCARKSQDSPHNAAEAEVKAPNSKDGDDAHLDGAFQHRMKGLFHACADSVSTGDGNALVKLAHFLNGGTYGGRMRMCLESFDCAQTGSLTAENLSNGLEWMNYTSFDARGLFQMLDIEGVGHLEINFVEDRLMQLIRAEACQP